VISPNIYAIASYGILGLLHKSLRVSTAAVKSDSLKSYALLKPSGPYFLRSRIAACMKIAPKASLLKMTPL